MRYRPLGNTGVMVSEIGFGAWGIGGSMWLGAKDAESMQALHRAADLGMNFFDTALVYGRGHSERLVGRLLKERPETLIVATKIPPKNNRWPARTGTKISEAFPHDYIIKRTEQSLKNLGCNVIDLQQFHVWLDEWVEEPEWYDAIAQLKGEGKIRYFGVSINDHQPSSALELARSEKVDALQVIYNIFDQSPERELFPLCRQKGIGVLARVPLDEGGLTGTIRPDTTFPENDWRNNYFREDRRQQVFERTERLGTLLGEEASSLPELALRFCLHHEATSTVIPGMRTARHVEQNCAFSDARRLSPQLVQRLREYAWERNFYA